MQRETVLITGASAGIGREIARVFAAQGARLVLVARRGDRLAELAAELRDRHGAEHRIEVCDLVAPLAATSLVARLAREGWMPDVAVLNAGFGLHGAFLEQEPTRLVEMVALNVTALTELAARLAPHMVEQRRGGLLLVASLAAFQPMSYFAVYAATKAYVLSFGEALAGELGPHGVKVSVFCPGPVPTEFRDVAGSPARYASFLNTPNAAAAAHAAVDGYRAGRVVVLQPRLRGWISTLAVRWVPRALVRRLAASFG